MKGMSRKTSLSTRLLHLLPAQQNSLPMPWFSLRKGIYTDLAIDAALKFDFLRGRRKTLSTSVTA